MDGGRTNQHVAHVGTGKNGGDAELFRPGRLDVLHRVNGKVDLAFEQPGVELLGPQRLAADLGERAVKDLVATGGDGDDLHHAFGPSVGGAKPVAGLFGLRHGKRGAAGSEPQRAFRCQGRR